MKKKLFVAGVSLATTMAVAFAAHAVILATAGDVVVFLPPDVRLNQTESDTDIMAFQERPCFQLPADLDTDQGTVNQGTWVKSYFLHADPVTTATLQGRIRFSDPIIGVISTTQGLYDSAICQRPGVVYPVDPDEAFWGLDAQTPLDDYNLLAPNELAVRMDIPSWTDNIRVLTSCGDD